jgi:WD40 repeat protein
LMELGSFAPLPTEVILHIAQYLEESLYAFGATCRSFFELTQDDSLGKIRYRLAFPLFPEPPSQLLNLVSSSVVVNEAGENTLTSWRARIIKRRHIDRCFLFGPDKYVGFDAYTKSRIQSNTATISDASPLITSDLGATSDMSNKACHSLFFDETTLMAGSCANKNSVAIFDLTTRQLVCTIPTESPAQNLQFDDEKLILGTWDNNLKIYDISQLREKIHSNSRKVLQQQKPIKDFDTNSNSTSNNLVRLRNVYKEHTSCLNAVRFNNELGLLVTGSSDASVKVWTLGNEFNATVLETRVGHYSGIRYLAFNSTHIASASYDSTVRIWDTETGRVLGWTKHSDSWARWVQIDSQKFISCATDEWLHICDLRMLSGGLVTPQQKVRLGFPLETLQYDDTKLLVAGGSNNTGKDNAVVCMDLRRLRSREATTTTVTTSTEERIRKLYVPSTKTWCLQFRDQLFAVGLDSGLLMWNIES